MYISVFDPYGRQISSLRIAVTQKCNQNCIYCHNEGQIPSLREMTLEDFDRIFQAASSLGVKKVKITGGEPLMRKDIIEIVESCSRYFREVSLTTNGVLLRDLAKPLRVAGLARMNVSLDSLDPLVYEKITGKNDLPRVLEGVDAAFEAGYQPIKLNAVMLKGLNTGEIKALAQFSSERKSILQLIELTSRRREMNSSFYERYHYDLTNLERALGSWASCVDINEIHNRKRYTLTLNGSKAVVEIVRPMSNKDFCSNCTRIRVTSDGRIKPCLLTNSGEVETLNLLRAGEDLETLKGLFLQAISSRKPYWD